MKTLYETVVEIVCIVIRHIDQWNQIRSPEVDKHIYSQLILDKGLKVIQKEMYSLFNKHYWNNWISIFLPITCVTIKPQTLPHTKHTEKPEMDNILDCEW